MEKQNLYRIGTVASLTGISVERLRAWERRYDLTPAHKSGKTRFYSRPQLDRLKLIKQLIDQGQPISSLANLSMDQLYERLEEELPGRRLDVAHRPTVGLIGPNLSALEQQVTQGSGTPRLQVSARWANMEAFAAECPHDETEAPQIMLVQLPVLAEAPIDLVADSFPDSRIVVVYQFATARTLSQLEGAGRPTLKWPLTWSELEHIAIAELGSTGSAPGVVDRLYSDEELIAIASEDSDPSHCPQYLVEAINQLNAFAGYAEDCARSLDTTDAGNGRYHQLFQNTALARAQLEQALDQFITELNKAQP